MVVKEKPASSGQQAIKRKYPVTDGLILGTTKLDGQDSKLEPEEDLTSSSVSGWGSI